MEPNPKGEGQKKTGGHTTKARVRKLQKKKKEDRRKVAGCKKRNEMSGQDLGDPLEKEREPGRQGNRRHADHTRAQKKTSLANKKKRLQKKGRRA